MKPQMMGIRPSCARRDDRYMLGEAWVEWRDAGGAVRKLQVLDLSRGGFNVGLEAGAAPVPEGTEMGEVVLNVAGKQIRGRLIVTQSLDSTTRGATCGGEFHPASFDDMEHYRAVIAGLEQSSNSKTMP